MYYSKGGQNQVVGEGKSLRHTMRRKHALFPQVHLPVLLCKEGQNVVLQVVDSPGEPEAEEDSLLAKEIVPHHRKPNLKSLQPHQAQGRWVQGVYTKKHWTTTVEIVVACHLLAMPQSPVNTPLHILSTLLLPPQMRDLLMSILQTLPLCPPVYQISQMP